ncbi:MAG: sulfatase-like hydrolase/transferase, partial [Akkermansiaceae bacterium]
MKCFNVLVASCLLFAFHASAQNASKPNFIFIISDDQSYETIRALGYTDIDTPNLDRLTNSGTTFTHAYNMGAWHGAVCVASRTMLATGRTVWNAQALGKSLNAERE